MVNNYSKELDKDLAKDIKSLMDSVDGFIVNKDIVINEIRSMYLGESWSQISLN